MQVVPSESLETIGSKLDADSALWTIFVATYGVLAFLVGQRGAMAAMGATAVVRACWSISVRNGVVFGALWACIIILDTRIGVERNPPAQVLAVTVLAVHVAACGGLADLAGQSGQIGFIGAIVLFGAAPLLFGAIVAISAAVTMGATAVTMGATAVVGMARPSDPHQQATSASFFFFFLIISHRVEWYKSLRALNTSPPWNCFALLRGSCSRIGNCTVRYSPLLPTALD